jgi:hypothetical protein
MSVVIYAAFVISTVKCQRRELFYDFYEVRRNNIEF